VQLVETAVRVKLVLGDRLAHVVPVEIELMVVVIARPIEIGHVHRCLGVA